MPNEGVNLEGILHMDRNFFKDELMKKEILKTITSKAQVLGKQGTIGTME